MTNQNTLFMKNLSFIEYIVYKQYKNNTYFLGREKTKVLKSETKVVKLKKNNQRKPLLRKSKLGEIVSKHRENITSECSVSEIQNKKVFGRKFSLSLENFNSLTLGERKENSPEKYSTESFKKTNVRSYMNHEHKL